MVTQVNRRKGGIPPGSHWWMWSMGTVSYHLPTVGIVCKIKYPKWRFTSEILTTRNSIRGAQIDFCGPETEIRKMTPSKCIAWVLMMHLLWYFARIFQAVLVIRVASFPGKAMIKAVCKHSVCSGSSTVTRDLIGTSLHSIYKTSLCTCEGNCLLATELSLWHTVLKMVAVKVALLVEEWKVSRGLNELVLHPAGPAGGH